MTIARGINAELCGRFETTWGTAATGPFDLLPFRTLGFGSVEALEQDQILGYGRGRADPDYGEEVLDGPATVPLELRNLGTWLKAAFGPPTTTGSGPYQHLFRSGAADLPSLTLEKGFPDIGQFFLCTGVMVNQLTIPFVRSGMPDVGLELIGRAETVAQVSAAGTPVKRALRKFTRFHGALAMDGVPLAGAVEGSFTYNNALEGSRPIGSRQLDELAPGIPTCSGTTVVRFKDVALYAKAQARAPVSFTFTYELSAAEQLEIRVPRVFLPRTKPAPAKPGGIEVSYDWQAADPATAGAGADPFVQVILINDVPAY